MNNISTVIITKNAERHLEQVLGSLHWCDDVVILDCGSEDRTCAIALASGARLAHQDWLGFGEQKRVAAALAKHDWILSLDADEVLPDHAAAVLEQLDFSDPQHCWRLPRTTWIGTRACRHGIFAGDAPIRLFNRRATNFTAVPVHEAVSPTPTVSTLPLALDHYSFADCAELFERMARYSRTKTMRLRARGISNSTMSLLARAIWAFGKTYLLKRGFLDGSAGLCACLSAAADAAVGRADAIR